MLTNRAIHSNLTKATTALEKAMEGSKELVKKPPAIRAPWGRAKGTLGAPPFRGKEWQSRRAGKAQRGPLG